MKSALLTAATFAILVPAAARAQTPPASPAGNTLSTASTASPASSPPAEDVIVTGTRQTGRTKQESPAPVDVITQADLQRTGQQDVFDALSKVLPSLDLPGFGFDTAGLVRSARLRGLSPDDTLVLIDGKRRHVSANINADIGPSGGSDPVDLDMIPISLIDHIEVLRDGAAAQYGSDAIAGVINIILKHADHGGSAYAQEGAFYAGDGFTNDLGTSLAMPLGQSGFLDVAGNYRYHDHTNRDGDYPAQTDGLRYIPPGTSRIEGDPKYNLVNLGYNAGYDVGDTTFYSFGTYGNRAASSFENFRKPNTPGIDGSGSGAYQTDPGTPFGSLTPGIYFPNGFVPREGLDENDFAFTAGVKGVLPDDWHWDLSSVYGADFDNISTYDSVNPDFLHSFGFSPTGFHSGEFNNSEWTNNLDISKPVDISFLAAPLNIAFGGEFRRNTYQIVAGDFASRYEGGAQAYPGFSLASQGQYHRSNEAAYADFATYLLPHWQIDVAGRFEHYSDVGDTETGKITSRYDFTKQFAIRGTISNGFRAPTLAQEGFAAVNVAPTFATAQFPVDSPGARLLGSTPLKAERSQNYSIGFVATPVEHMHAALDFYQIDIRDQIVDSGLFSGPLVANAFALNGSGVPAGAAGSILAQFYTNGVNTRTQGADFTVDYLTELGDNSRINWLAAGNFNSVQLTRVAASGSFTPDVLSEIKEATPKSKILVQAIYAYDPFSVTLRETRFGQVVEILADGNSGYTPFTSNRIGPKFITDLEFGYKITTHLTLSLGADNLFDTYSAHTTAQARFNNAEEYIAASPYGIDGGFYYGRLAYTF
jgi:iron complex outermembrane receptor protein